MGFSIKRFVKLKLLKRLKEMTQKHKPYLTNSYTLREYKSFKSKFLETYKYVLYANDLKE